MSTRPQTIESKQDADGCSLPASPCSPSFIYSGQGEFWGAPEVIGFGSDTFAVREMDRATANDLIRKNHYSKTTYNNTLCHLGVYSPDLLGVLQFGQAMNPQSMGGVVEGTEIDEAMELNRMWLHDALPRNSESRAISYAIKYLKRKNPRLGWIQSFADERCGRWGVVYQAANFLYCGEHSSTFWELDGEMYHNSAMTRNDKGRGKRPEVLQANKDRATPHTLRQFRYIYFIKKRFRSRLKLDAKPYPKHASEGSMESRPVTNGEGQGQILHDAPISSENDK